MCFSSIYVVAFIVGLVLNFTLYEAIHWANYRHRKQCGLIVPQELSGVITAEDAKSTYDYKNANYKLFVVEHIVETLVGAALVFLLFYPYIFDRAWAVSGNIYATIILFSILSSLPTTVLSLPFSLYDEFVIEKRFGFSTMTLKLWLLDALKSLLIGLVVSSIILLLATFVLEHFDAWWWALATVFVGFSLLISVIYPTFIAPIFNKFTPLEEGELKDKITRMMEEVGLNARSLFVMDASKRSKHSNAYFTGFGKSKRVVLYDTLLHNLCADEIVAVLAHELGHFKKHHIAKRLVVMIPIVYIMLFLMNLVVKDKSLYQAFGFVPTGDLALHTDFVGLFLLNMIVGEYSLITGFLQNVFSRKAEFEADNFSKMLCKTGEHLISALIKLNKENKSELDPAKVYSAFMYSHPTLLERIKNLEK